MELSIRETGKPVVADTLQAVRFGEISILLQETKVVGNIWKDCLVFWENFNLFWQTSSAIGHILVAKNDQIFNNIFAIWSHCNPIFVTYHGHPRMKERINAFLTKR